MASDSASAQAALAKAEEKFKCRDLPAARSYAYKAQEHCPSLPGLQQTIAALDVLFAASTKRLPDGATDWHAVLGVDPSASDLDTLKKRHKKLCLLTHPDKNPSAAADGAFKLVMQAWEAINSKTTTNTTTTTEENNMPSPPPPPPAPPASMMNQGQQHPSRSAEAPLFDDSNWPAGGWKMTFMCPFCICEFEHRDIAEINRGGSEQHGCVRCPSCCSWIAFKLIMMEANSPGSYIPFGITLVFAASHPQAREIVSDFIRGGKEYRKCSSFDYFIFY